MAVGGVTGSERVDEGELDQRVDGSPRLGEVLDGPLARVDVEDVSTKGRVLRVSLVELFRVCEPVFCEDIK